MAFNHLPENYHLTREIDMRKDKRIAFWLNLVGTLVFLATGVVGYFIHPVTDWMSFDLYQVLALVLGLFIYIILHELIHAFFMRLFCKAKVNFGFHTYAAFAGMKQGYFTKAEYIIIALAPVVLLGAALVCLNIFLPESWFWAFFIIQGQNIAGAVGDYFVIILLLKTPRKTLVNDDGMSMRYYVGEGHSVRYDEDPVDDFPDLQ